MAIVLYEKPDLGRYRQTREICSKKRLFANSATEEILLGNDYIINS